MRDCPFWLAAGDFFISFWWMNWLNLQGTDLESCWNSWRRRIEGLGRLMAHSLKSRPANTQPAGHTNFLFYVVFLCALFFVCLHRVLFALFYSLVVFVFGHLWGPSHPTVRYSLTIETVKIKACCWLNWFSVLSLSWSKFSFSQNTHALTCQLLPMHHAAPVALPHANCTHPPNQSLIRSPCFKPFS